jgi:hypothetical protein
MQNKLWLAFIALANLGIQAIGTWLRRLGKDNQGIKALRKANKTLLKATLNNYLIGETVFWLKSLYQLGFVRFFGFYFWIGEYSKKLA